MHDIHVRFSHTRRLPQAVQSLAHQHHTRSCVRLQHCACAHQLHNIRWRARRGSSQHSARAHGRQNFRRLQIGKRPTATAKHLVKKNSKAVDIALGCVVAAADCRWTLPADRHLIVTGALKEQSTRKSYQNRPVEPILVCGTPSPHQYLTL